MDQITEFSESIDRSLQFMQDLEHLMLLETEVLASRDIGRLQPILTEKQALIERLEQETGRQKQWVEGAGHAFTPAGIARFFRELDPSARLSNHWSTLKEAIERCDRLNHANGLLIERGRKRVAMSLRLLSGDDGQSTTYDPHGRPSSSKHRSRTLSRA
ncbi:flagella synthesis protein FlgN [Imhoffiella purpurea]|uniref:Flagellar biosynthesis protein FlgN n=1 Tax=Imhoffiella purpurea TaxID=1249627 RepID=W9VBE3_9GAMM|nr:flagellar protein FlgN [Imhoffiella purpurea]EXJ16898.1 Flagellar biosynthesis protein FlgN [Imhoffiella purpurea]